MAFKMKGMPGIAGVKAEKDKIDELSGKSQKVMKVKPKDEFSTIASRKRIHDSRYRTARTEIEDQEDYEESKTKTTELGGRWKGMTLNEFDANVEKERKSIGNDPKTLKAFNARQAKLREQAINAD
tara:strand:- start:9 stop:386 length:378 start_codon:yes stop_codon:yes gene_type:complete